MRWRKEWRSGDSVFGFEFTCGQWATSWWKGMEYYFLPHQKVPSGKCFLLFTPCPSLRLQVPKYFPVLPFMLHVNWLIILQKPFHQYQSDIAYLYFHVSYTAFVWTSLEKWLKMTSVSQPMTQQGRMATPAKVCFPFQQCLTLPLRLKCLCPSKNSSSISFLGFTTIPPFSGLLFLVVFKWRKRCSL